MSLWKRQREVDWIRIRLGRFEIDGTTEPTGRFLVKDSVLSFNVLSMPWMLC